MTIAEKWQELQNKITQGDRQTIERIINSDSIYFNGEVHDIPYYLVELARAWDSGHRIGAKKPKKQADSDNSRSLL